MSAPFYIASGAEIDQETWFTNKLRHFGADPINLQPSWPTAVDFASGDGAYWYIKLGGESISTSSFGGTTWGMNANLGATILYRARVGGGGTASDLLNLQVQTLDELKLRLDTGGLTFACEIQSQVPNFYQEASAATGYDSATAVWATLGCVFTSPPTIVGDTQVEAYLDGALGGAQTVSGKSGFSTTPSSLTLDASNAPNVDVAAVLMFDTALTAAQMAEAHEYMVVWTGVCFCNVLPPRRVYVHRGVR